MFNEGVGPNWTRPELVLIFLLGHFLKSRFDSIMTQKVIGSILGQFEIFWNSYILSKSCKRKSSSSSSGSGGGGGVVVLIIIIIIIIIIMEI